MDTATAARCTDPITLTQARHAIYVDFEGNVRMPPSVLGVLYSPRPGESRPLITQTVVEPALAALARRSALPRDIEVEHIGAEPLVDVLTDLLAIAEVEGRIIVSWAWFDLDKVLESDLPDDLKQRLAARWRNGQLDAKRWRKVLGKRKVKRRGHTLERYMRTVPHRVPEAFGPGVTGRALRAARAQAAKGRTYKELPPGVQVGWAAMLGHNYHDLVGLRAVTLKVVAALEDAEARAVALEGEGDPAGKADSGRRRLGKPDLGNLLAQLPPIDPAWFRNPDGCHGLGHMRRSAIHALAIAAELGLPEDETLAAVSAAAWHDIGRASDGGDYMHGARSAGKVLGLGLTESMDPATRDMLLFAIEYHCQDLQWAERNIGVYWRAYPEALWRVSDVVKDADALDRVRFHGPESVRVDWLRFDYSKEQLGFAELLVEMVG